MKKFQNKQHERLHNALINAGFTDCGGENLPNCTLGWNCGYINEQLDEYLYFDDCVNDFIRVRRISNDEATECHWKPVSNIITHYESLAQTQPITKDNIKEVLEFNNITDISVQTNSLSKESCFGLSMKSDNWLDILEAIVGKLKPLPKIPEFDFEQYLLDNGFEVEQGQHGIVLKFSYVSIYKSELLTGGNWDYQGSRIQPTPQNADILIAMVNLAKDLK